jgi:hypothetical protein
MKTPKTIVRDMIGKNYIIRDKNDGVTCSICGKYLGKATTPEKVYALMEEHIATCSGKR